MYRIVATVVLASLALAAHANGEGVELSLKTKALAAGSVAPKSAAPFAAGRDPLPQLMLEDELDRRGPGGVGCEFSAKDVCYDLTDGRLVYRPVRGYMPKVEGLKPEGISLRRNRINFRYSFR